MLADNAAKIANYHRGQEPDLDMDLLVAIQYVLFPDWTGFI